MERRKAQLEHAKRAETERLKEEAESRKRMLEHNLAEDINPEQKDLCEGANVHTRLTPAPKSFAPEPRTIQPIEKATEEPQVPGELQGFGQDSMEDDVEASNEQERADEANETHRFPGETSREIETCKAGAAIVTFTIYKYLRGQMGLGLHGSAWCCSAESKMRMESRLGIYISCTLEAPDRPAEQRKRCVA